MRRNEMNRTTVTLLHTPLLLAGVLVIAVFALFTGGCDLSTLPEYLEDRNRRSEEAAFVPVTDITGIPDGAAMRVPLILEPVVVPENAANKALTWTLSSPGTTGAAVTGSFFLAQETGEAVITATVADGLAQGQDFVKNFTITVTEEFVSVTNIILTSPDAVASGTPLTLNASAAPGWATNRAIEWSLVDSGTTGASLTGKVLTASEGGTAVVRAVVINGLSQNPAQHFTKDFTITVLKTATPTVSSDFVLKSLNGMANAPFNLTNSFEDGAVWKVYDGYALASGVTVSVAWPTLTLSHASDVPAGTYDVTVTEPGKGESDRAALTVIGQYSITYHLDEGTLPGGAPETYRTDELPLSLPAPTREGYFFIGWYDNAQFQGNPVTMIPADSTGPKEFWAKWCIDVGITTSVVSEGWSYDMDTKVITIEDGADVTLTGSTGSNRVVVAPGATATVTLRNVTIWSGSSNVVVFNGTDATVALLLEGNNTVTASMEPAGGFSMGCYAFKVTNLIIDSASSVNAGTDASSRSTLGTLRAAGGGWGSTGHGRDVGGAFGGSVTLLGGVVTAESGYFNYQAVNGSLTAKGGVFIGKNYVSTFTAGSLAVVFLVGAPSAAYQDDHGDLVACGSEVSFDGNTITLNEALTIPSGVTLRVPSGWTLNTNGFLTNNGTVIKDGTISGDISGTGTVTP
jgi:uncharacterized repeat protein (TIGR02543 family)